MNVSFYYSYYQSTEEPGRPSGDRLLPLPQCTSTSLWTCTPHQHPHPSPHTDAQWPGHPNPLTQAKQHGREPEAPSFLVSPSCWTDEDMGARKRRGIGQAVKQGRSVCFWRQNQRLGLQLPLGIRTLKLEATTPQKRL